MRIPIQEPPRQAQRRHDGVTTEDWQWRRLNLTLKVRDAVRESWRTGSLGIAGLFKRKIICAAGKGPPILCPE